MCAQSRMTDVLIKSHVKKPGHAEGRWPCEERDRKYCQLLDTDFWLPELGENKGRRSRDRWHGNKEEA